MVWCWSGKQQRRFSAQQCERVKRHYTGVAGGEGWWMGWAIEQQFRLDTTSTTYLLSIRRNGLWYGLSWTERLRIRVPFCVSRTPSTIAYTGWQTSLASYWRLIGDNFTWLYWIIRIIKHEDHHVQVHLEYHPKITRDWLDLDENVVMNYVSDFFIFYAKVP
jgi:hypothetical protein